MFGSRSRAALLAGIALAIVGLVSADEPGVTWYSIVAASGDAVGNASRTVVAHPDGNEIVETEAFDVKEEGVDLSHLSRRTVTEEDQAGRPRTIAVETLIGDSWTRLNARIGSDKAEIVREAPNDRRTVTVALPPQVRFDSGEGLLVAWDPARDPELAYDNFNIGALSVDRQVIRALPRGEDGRTALLRETFSDGALVGIEHLYLDAGRHVIELTQPMFGTTIAIRLSDKATALKPHKPYQALYSAMAKSPYRIGPPAMKGHIRYVFAFRDGVSFPFPETGEQRSALKDGVATVDICTDCGPGLPTDPAYLADALKPTAWLQSDAPKIRAFARGIAHLDETGARKMNLLIAKATPYLGKLDFAGHFSALEALERKRGDCTEASVLLAALGRAAGIPTRVVNGLVYSRERYHGVANVFMPHSWTLAYVEGRWRSFDLALGNFDTTHIALNVGDGDERQVLAGGQLAGLLIWQSMAEVRSPS